MAGGVEDLGGTELLSLVTLLPPFSYREAERSSRKLIYSLFVKVHHHTEIMPSLNERRGKHGDMLIITHKLQHLLASHRGVQNGTSSEPPLLPGIVGALHPGETIVMRVVEGTSGIVLEGEV